ncbi:MAG: TonB-dependent receptor, partial [Methylobacter sp.]|nr:TonB-dependent receptor [Methylobacter sp.]
AVVFCCFFDGFAFIKIMTYEITDYHIIPLIYNDYLVNLCIGLQDLGYIYWTPLDWLAFSSEYRYQQFSRDYNDNNSNFTDPQSLATHQVPLTVKFFHPNGIFAKFSGTYVNQQVGLVSDLDVLPANSPPITFNNSRFWTFDSSLGYRLPKKIGTVSLEVHNLFNSNLRYQSIFDAEGPQMSPFIPQRQVFLKLSLFY